MEHLQELIEEDGYIGAAIKLAEAIEQAATNAKDPLVAMDMRCFADSLRACADAH